MIILFLSIRNTLIFAVEKPNIEVQGDPFKTFFFIPAVGRALVIKDSRLTYLCDSILNGFNEFFTSHKECVYFGSTQKG